MSLRSKIILLFVGLAIVPILGVAAFGSRQAIGLAAEAMAAYMRVSADRAADEVARELDAVDARLDRLATDPATLAFAAGELSAEEWRSEVSAWLGGLAYVEVSSTSGTRAAWRLPADESVRCRGGFSSRLVTLRRPLPTPAEDAVLSAGLRLDELPLAGFRGSTSTLALMHRDTGVILLSTDCGPAGLHAEAALPELFSGTGPGQGARFRGPDGQERIGGLGPVAGRPWTLVASIPTSMVLAPLYRIQRSYWLFVLLLTLSTGAAFSILLGGVIRSLEQLTQAAERIGGGEMNPWLPPPGRDEVGRLSSAFGQMLDRVRQMMQRIDQEGRLAVVGRLTSYLAHEIRNPLSSIRLNLQSLRRDFENGAPASDESLESIDICLREVDRLSNSVNRVLRLGSSSTAPRQEVGIHDVVEEAAQLLAEQCEKAGVVVRLELDAGADRVVAAPGQLKGVFLNLLMNAVEAQPQGGEIVVRSELRAIPGQGPALAISVADEGHGIAPELRDRIFEPFFTTKEAGSGIGLASAQRAVRENGGDLYLADRAESLPGCELVVELPLAPRAQVIDEPHRVRLPEWMKSDPAAAALAPAALGEPRPQEGLS